MNSFIPSPKLKEITKFQNIGLSKLKLLGEYDPKPRNFFVSFLNFHIIILVAISFVCVHTSFAVPNNFPVPRFVTIKFNEVNARTGPENDCPIEWVFVKKSEPVEVIAEFGQWRKIRDIKGEGGWVHSTVIAGNRSVVVVAKNPILLLGSPGKYENVVAKLLPEIRCSLNKCQKEWCQITCKSYKGWVARKFLWGVYPEEFDS